MADPKPRKKPNTEFAAKVKLAELKQYLTIKIDVLESLNPRDGELPRFAPMDNASVHAYREILARLTSENGK